MENECRIATPEQWGGNKTESLPDGTIAFIIFSPQLQEARNMQGGCQVISLLRSGGSKKKLLQGPEFSMCQRCGRDISVIISNK